MTCDHQRFQGLVSASFYVSGLWKLVQRSTFWTGLLLDSIVFVCAAGGKEKTDLVSKSSALQGLLKPRPSSSSSFSLP